MKLIIILPILLSACSDTGCEIREEQIRTQSGYTTIYQRCVEERCENQPVYRRCYKW
jgi:hypothetical protein